MRRCPSMRVMGSIVTRFAVAVIAVSSVVNLVGKNGESPGGHDEKCDGQPDVSETHQELCERGEVDRGFSVAECNGGWGEAIVQSANRGEDGGHEKNARTQAQPFVEEHEGRYEHEEVLRVEEEGVPSE